ncbi:MAG: hypothetical protein LBF83_09500 [Spirochaetaceae bacterium]|jgi:hypothetical protein|nr:hypothetical protein [Spirochaetaceae bacterium]
MNGYESGKAAAKLNAMTDEEQTAETIGAMLSLNRIHSFLIKNTPPQAAGNYTPRD